MGESKANGLKVIVHSFFVIPVLIAIGAVLVIGGFHLLTREKHTPYDHLRDIQVGGATKRWQAAFELSKVFQDPKKVPTEERFSSQMIALFKQSEHDDPRIRQYLAVAMGKSGQEVYQQTLEEALQSSEVEQLSSVIHGLGLLRRQSSAVLIEPYVQHEDAHVRLAAVIALGTIASPSSVSALEKALEDRQANVAWDAAVGLAKMGQKSSKKVLLNLMDRQYYESFLNVDRKEQNQSLLVAVKVSASLRDDPEIQQALQSLGQSDPNMLVRRAALELLKGTV